MRRIMPVRTAAPTNRRLPIAHEAKLASLSIALSISNAEVRKNTRVLAEWHTPAPIARPESSIC
jgi:hypothetical protein